MSFIFVLVMLYYIHVNNFCRTLIIQKDFPVHDFIVTALTNKEKELFKIYYSLFF